MDRALPMAGASPPGGGNEKRGGDEHRRAASNDPARLELVDGLRGFALMGLFLVHAVELFELYWVHPVPDPWFDATMAVFAGKAFSLFALCFGLSFSIIMDRTRRTRRRLSRPLRLAAGPALPDRAGPRPRLSRRHPPGARVGRAWCCSCSIASATIGSCCCSPSSILLQAPLCGADRRRPMTAPPGRMRRPCS